MKYKVTLNGRVYEVDVEQGEAILAAEYDLAAPAPVQAAPAPVAAAAPAVEAAAPAAVPVAVAQVAGETFESPLPGAVVKVSVKEGEAVKLGQLLVVIEAMKMENEVLSPRDGVIAQVLATTGTNVNTGDVLFVFA
jgi:Biotin carboxyl carrier protein